MKRLPWLLLLCLTASTAMAGTTAQALDEIKLILTTKADRYSSTPSNCGVQAISKTSISFGTFSGDHNTWHTETATFKWSDVSSIVFSPKSAHPKMTGIRLGLRNPVDQVLMTKANGHTQTQHGMEDKFDFYFSRQRDADRFRDLVHQVISALHGPPPPHRHWHQGGAKTDLNKINE